MEIFSCYKRSGYNVKQRQNQNRRDRKYAQDTYNDEEEEAGWITPFSGGSGGKLFDFSSFTFKSIVGRGQHTGPNES